MSFKDKLIEFLKLEKWKIIIALAGPYFWIFLRFSYNYFQGILEINLFISFLLAQFHPFLVFSHLLESIIMYPFACSIILLFKACKQRKFQKLRSDKAMFSLIIAGILIFNPLTVNIILALLAILLISPHKPYGVEIVGVMPGSLAQKMNLKPGDYIIEIELGKYTLVERNKTYEQVFINKYRKPIRNSSDMSEVFNRVSEWNSIQVGFFGGNAISSSLGDKIHTTLGIKVRDAQGNEAIL